MMMTNEEKEAEQPEPVISNEQLLQMTERLLSSGLNLLNEEDPQRQRAMAMEEGWQKTHQQIKENARQAQIARQKSLENLVSFLNAFPEAAESLRDQILQLGVDPDTIKPEASEEE